VYRVEEHKSGQGVLRVQRVKNTKQNGRLLHRKQKAASVRDGRVMVVLVEYTVKLK